MGPWPSDLSKLSDSELVELARQVHHQLWWTRRDDAKNAELIRQWGQVCREANHRGISDGVTEGGSTEASSMFKSKETRNQQ